MRLTDEDLVLVISALDDAAWYRSPEVGECHDCRRDNGLCEDHAGDEALAGRYGRLRSRLVSGDSDVTRSPDHTPEEQNDHP